MGGEASGSGGCPVPSTVKWTKVYERGLVTLMKRKNWHLWPDQKGKLTMDPLVESSWRFKEHSTPIEETVSLVGKSTDMPGTTSGSFVP